MKVKSLVHILYIPTLVLSLCMLCTHVHSLIVLLFFAIFSFPIHLNETLFTSQQVLKVLIDCYFVIVIYTEVMYIHVCYICRKL